MNKLLTLNLAKYIPALLKLVEYKPTTLVFSLTYKCNCRCIMCNYWKFASEQELPSGKVKDILRQASQIGIKNCVFYGGEPILRRDIFELVSYAHKGKLRTGLISNGILIDREKAGALVESGLDEITLSIDTCSDELDNIRGIQGAYRKVFSALTEFARLRENHPLDIKIACLLMLPTLEEDRVLKLVEFAGKLSVPVIIQLVDFSLFYFKDVDENNKRKLWIEEKYQKELNSLVDRLIEIKKKDARSIDNSIPSLNYIRRYFRDPKSADIPCYIAFSGRIWVDPQGGLYLCQGLPPLGDLKEEKLADVINSERWRRRLYSMFKKQCPGCSCMYSSNIDAHIPLAWKDMLSKKAPQKL